MNFISLACSNQGTFPLVEAPIPWEGESTFALILLSLTWTIFAFNFYDNVQLSLISYVILPYFRIYILYINFEDDNCILSRSVIFWGWCLVVSDGGESPSKLSPASNTQNFHGQNFHEDREKRHFCIPLEGQNEHQNCNQFEVQIKMSTLDERQM